MPDALRLALGTLTAIRVPAPREVTRTVAGRAMLLAPLVGAMLGLLVSTVPAVVGLLSPEHRTRTSVDLLTSVLSVGLLALLTRGLHLDGLADTTPGPSAAFLATDLVVVGCGRFLPSGLFSNSGVGAAACAALRCRRHQGPNSPPFCPPTPA